MQKLLKEFLKSYHGVDEANVNFATEKLNITYDDSKIKLSDIQNAS